MKRIAFLFLLLSLTACSIGNNASVTPTLVVTATPTATPKPTETPTPTPLPISPDIQAAIGDESFAKLKDSIGASGETSVTDYQTGSNFDAVVIPETIIANSTADWHFKNIVNTEAKDKQGNIFKVVWNPDTGKWIKVTEINSDLLDYENYTHFNNIDKMAETGDLDLVILSQSGFAQSFPDNVETPNYWMEVGHNQIVDNGKKIEDFFFYLFPARQDKSEYLYNGLGSFTIGSEAFRNLIVKGRTSDGKEIYQVENIIQNTDKTNIINKLGFDPRYFEHIFVGAYSIDAQGKNGLERILMDQTKYLVPIIPTAHPEDWGNFYQNGGQHGILVNGGFVIDDPIVALQKPGEAFDLLPDYMKLQLEVALDKLRPTNYAHSSEVFMFADGKIPEGLAKFLSRHISEAGFWYGSRTIEGYPIP